MTTETLRTAQPDGSVTSRIGRELRGIANAWSIPAVKRGFVAMCLISIGALSPAFLPPADVNPFRSLPVAEWMQAAPGMWVATGILLAGVLLLLDSWLRMRPGAGRPRPVREVLWVWSVPILLAPPLFSRDAFSYAAQGWLVNRGIDPYVFAPSIAAEKYLDKVDPMWLQTPAPYGPLALEVQRAVVIVTGDHAYLAAVLMRIPAMVGVILLAVLLPRIARTLGYDGDLTTWLAVINPLVLMHLVGGEHNDALMLGLTVLGIWLAIERRPYLGAIAVAAAATFKLPAVAALLAIAAIAARDRSDPYRVPTMGVIIRRLVPLVAVVLAFFVVSTKAAGLDFTWLYLPFTVPTVLRSALSPVAWIGNGVEWVFLHFSLPGAASSFKITTTILAVAGVLLAARIALKQGPRAPLRSLSLVIIVVVFSSPVVHPWYVLWGGLLYVVTVRSPREWRLVVWGTAGLVIYSAIDASFSNGALALGIAVAVALAWIATGHSPDLDEAPAPVAAGGGRTDGPSGAGEHAGAQQ